MKMNRWHVQVVLLVLLISRVELSAQDNSLRTPSTKYDETVQRIRDCEVEAIEEAGRSRDKRFIPSLRESYRSGFRPCSDYEMQSLAALAKLGDREALQTVWCEVTAGEVEDVAGSLQYIRGWFSIRAALKLAEQDKRHFELAEKHAQEQRDWARKNLRPGEAWYGNDAIIPGTPRTWALRLLSELVSNPPVPYPKDDYESDPNTMDARIDRDLGVWRQWVRKNEARLKKMRPTGWNVTYTDKACSPQK